MAYALTGDGYVGTSRGLSRREVIRGAAIALAGVAGGLALTADLAQPGDGGVGPVAPPILLGTTFAPFVGDRFELRSHAAEPRALELFKLRPLHWATARAGTVDDESFSLLFRGPVAHPLWQGVHELEHHHIGSMALLLVPMRPEPDARYYEAIFNRSLPY